MVSLPPDFTALLSPLTIDRQTPPTRCPLCGHPEAGKDGKTDVLTILGMRVIVDPSLPPGTAYMTDGRTRVDIVNIGEAVN